MMMTSRSSLSAHRHPVPSTHVPSRSREALDAPFIIRTRADGQEDSGGDQESDPRLAGELGQGADEHDAEQDQPR